MSKENVPQTIPQVLEHFNKLADEPEILQKVRDQLPRPVVRDSKSSVSTYSELDWVYRVREELDEALAAETWAEKGEEIVDAITVCVSWLESLGFTEHARAELFRRVNAKNHARGYMEGK